MFFASLVLPVLALCLIAYFFCYPLPVLFGTVKFTQMSNPAPDQVGAIAKEREQDDEYDTLVALGFKPLGTQHESYGFLTPEQPTLVFVHEQLPVFAYLLVTSDKQLFLKMITTGQGDCILETSSCRHSIVANEPTFRANHHDVSNPEDIFCIHMEALGQWELEGFKPVAAIDLADSEIQNKIMMAKEPIKKLVRSASILVALGSLSTTFLLPVIFSVLSVLLYRFRFDLWPTPLFVLNILAGWVMLFAFQFYRTVVKPKQNSKRNSLGNRSAILTSKRVDIKKVIDGNKTRFELPYRNDPEQRVHALPFIFITIVVALLVGFWAVTVGGFWVFQVNPLFTIPCVLYAIIVYRYLLLVAASAWRVLLGKSIHEISIEDEKLHSRERKFILHFDQQCSIDKILSIHIEPIQTSLDYYPFFGVETNPDWGMLIVKRTPEDNDSPPVAIVELLQIGINWFLGRQRCQNGRPLQIAACYPLDVVTSLAYELADQIDLSAEQVFVSDDILNPKDSLEEAKSCQLV